MVTRTKKLFVGGLSASTTIEDVRSYFEQFGKVFRLLTYLLTYRDTILFSAILKRPGHLLHPLLHPLKTTGYHLRKRSRGLKLSVVQSSFFETEFFISNVIHGHLLNLFILRYCVFFEYYVIYFLLLFLYFNLYILT